MVNSELNPTALFLHDPKVGLKISGRGEDTTHLKIPLVIKDAAGVKISLI